jgi:ribosomal protein L11 methyltransferase
MQIYHTKLTLKLKKGEEELLPEEIYKILTWPGVWIEESETDTLVMLYTEDIKGLITILNRFNILPSEMWIKREPKQDFAGLVRRHFRPIRISDVVILPVWSNNKRDEKCIIIEPGMAFGTGRHESTKIMFHMIGQIDVRDKKVIDIGCGSAILSIYASLLGARPIFAIDNDIDAILSARKNVSLNDKMDCIRFACIGLNDVRGRFDIVLANLDVDTFISSSNHLKGLLSSDGYLLISGFLNEKEKEMISLFSPLTVVHKKRMGSWCGLILKGG